MLDSDDFDISPEDEAAFLEAENNTMGKRLCTDDDDAQPSHKRARTQSSSTTQLATKVLRETFGLERFRLKQEAAITCLLNGKNAVIVFPTGGGKSLCYQVPAVAFRELDNETGARSPGNSGVTVVISPLIALMKDQVDALVRRKINAAVLDSTTSRDVYLSTQEHLRNGQLDLLYCAPERLNMEGFIESLKSIPGGIRLLAVDEAHCISEWGHSFRPDYLKIARFAQEVSVERIVCLTATATPKVAQDICNAFSVPPEGLFSTTVYRPNLRLLAQSSDVKHDDVKSLIQFLRKNTGPAIVYVSIQKGAEELTQYLVNAGFRAKAYHAGLKTEVKTQTQDEFMLSKDLIVVATIAFGMGIDKPDVRNIVHFDMPSSIETYSQQIGRAGRDGKPSTCLINLSPKDFHLRNIFTYGDRPSKRSLRLLLEDIFSAKNDRLGPEDMLKVSHAQQSKDFDIGMTTLKIIYAHLELHFKLFRSAGWLYSEYKYEVHESRNLASDQSVEARTIVDAAKGSGKWKTVNLDMVALTSGVPRMDLVRKIDSWNERGVIELKKAGVQNLYRLEKSLPNTKEEIDKMENFLDEGMEAKENQDLERTKALINLITDKKCFSSSLAAYFGDTSGGLSAECGHCTWCETHKQVVLQDEPLEAPEPAKVKRVLEVCAVRDDPRFLARVAFGIKSPRVKTLKLDCSPVFESMTNCHFPELVRVFGAECSRAIAAT